MLEPTSTVLDSLQPNSAPQRKIIHVDMDAFYASVEQRDDPALRGRPVAVGGSRERGVVAAASYEARRFGVRSAMSGIAARRRCPDLVFVRPRFDVYKAICLQIRGIFAEHTPVIEPLSLDEAYLDVTENLQGIATATGIARSIRASIREQTGLTASAGVSYNKFLAKLASDHRKPDGLFVIPPERGPAFVENLDVGRFHGVGPVAAARMKTLGIHTGLDLRGRSMVFLQEQFGKSGPYYYWIARGVDERPVRADRVRKSVGSETTFPEDLHAFEPMRAELRPLAEKVWALCERSGTRGRTVTLKVKYADFQQVTRSRSFPVSLPDLATLERTVVDLLAPLVPVRLGVRLLGVTLSTLETGDTPVVHQLTMTL